MSFLAAKGLMVVARAAYTLECNLGLGIGGLTPQIPPLLRRRIACDMAYRNASEVALDIVGLGTSGILNVAGFNLTARIIGVALARRQLREFLGVEELFFLGLIPKEVLPIAAELAFLGDEVFDLVGAGLSVADDVAMILAGQPPPTGNLITDVVRFAQTGIAVYEELIRGGEIIGGEGIQLLEDIGTVTLLIPEAVAGMLRSPFEFREENTAALAALNGAIVSFATDVWQGFSALTNPFLGRRETPPPHPPPTEAGRRPGTSRLARRRRPPTRARARPPPGQFELLRRPPPENLLSLIRKEAPRRGFVGVSDLRSIIAELKRGNPHSATHTVRWAPMTVGSEQFGGGGGGNGNGPPPPECTQDPGCVINGDCSAEGEGATCCSGPPDCILLTCKKQGPNLRWKDLGAGPCP